MIIGSHDLFLLSQAFPRILLFIYSQIITYDSFIVLRIFVDPESVIIML